MWWWLNIERLPAQLRRGTKGSTSFQGSSLFFPSALRTKEGKRGDPGNEVAKVFHVNYLNSVNVWVQKETVVCSFNVEKIAKCKQNNSCFIRKGLKIKACPSDFIRISIRSRIFPHSPGVSCSASFKRVGDCSDQAFSNQRRLHEMSAHHIFSSKPQREDYKKEVLIRKRDLCLTPLSSTTSFI